jgi:preprotein translocase subunit SecA
MLSSAGNKEEKKIAIISYLISLAEKKYGKMFESFEGATLNFKEVEKGILIRSIDQAWVEHLETIDYLRRGIGLRSYGQRDPLVEYKKEAYRLYQGLNDIIRKQVTYSIYKTGDALAAVKEQEIKMFAQKPVEKLQFSGAQKEMHKQAEDRNTADLVHEKVKDESGRVVGRNDLCPCGSGKKYKKCCGK